MEGYIKCEVCGKHLKTINAAHLKKHNMTLVEYNEFIQRKRRKKSWKFILIIITSTISSIIGNVVTPFVKSLLRRITKLAKYIEGFKYKLLISVFTITATSSIIVYKLSQVEQPPPKSFVAPIITSLTANPEKIKLGETSSLTCRVYDPDSDKLTYKWEAAAGSISGGDSSVIWSAPNIEGTFSVFCKVLDENGLNDIKNINIKVKQSKLLKRPEIVTSSKRKIAIVPETNQINNLKLPDLTITDITGDSIYIYVHYTNKGLGISKRYFSIKIFSKFTGKSFPHTTGSVTFKVPKIGQIEKTGGYTIGLIGLKQGMETIVGAEIDWEGKILESNENNNILYKQVLLE